MLLRPLPSALVLVLLMGCSLAQTPIAAPAASASPAVVEAQDPCTQLTLQRLDGQLLPEPSVAPEVSVRANEVVEELVSTYDVVLTASGTAAARASVAADVAAACLVPAGEGKVVQVPVDPQPTG